MEATKAEVSEWFDRGLTIRPTQTHLLHVRSTTVFQNGSKRVVEYPAYAGSGPESIKDCIKHYERMDGQEILAVYDLRIEKLAQLLEEKPWHT